MLDVCMVGCGEMQAPVLPRAMWNRHPIKIQIKKITDVNQYRYKCFLIYPPRLE